MNREKRIEKILAPLAIPNGIECSSGSLLKKRDALHSRNFKTLAATHVLAHHHIVSPQHIRLSLRELRSIAIVGARWQGFLFHAHQPLDLILSGLMAVGTSQVSWLLVRLFIEKLAFIHKIVLENYARSGGAPLTLLAQERLSANLRLLHFCGLNVRRCENYSHGSQEEKKGFFRR
jgi:hypothetical protein